MQSVLGEVSKLRKGSPIIVDYHNSNRYRLVVQENNGTKTAYYFSCPIYNTKTRKVVDLKFHRNDGAIYCVGSNANITFSNCIRMENIEGYASISLENKISFISENELASGNHSIYPTVNGFLCKINCTNKKSFAFDLEVGKPFMEVRANNKCFSLMSERFRPFITISCIGTTDESGNVISPAKIEYQKLADKKYRLVISSTSLLAKHIFFEANLYENKLFQDTTVESMNPSTNNAFGGIGFIGNTLLYGEQWLYSRLDYSKIPEIMDKQIQKAVVHMPKFNQSNVELSAYKVSARFCSFGSNWDNKIAGDTMIANSYLNSNYQSMDFTSLLVDERNKIIIKSEGFILKPKIKGAGFSVIATADSHLAPQIMEINFK